MRLKQFGETKIETKLLIGFFAFMAIVLVAILKAYGVF